MNYVLTENAVRKIKRAITPRLGDGLAPTGGPATISPDTYAAPFTVRWAASLASPESSEGAGDATDGEWIIYLPTQGVLTVNHTAVNITSALTVAGGDYPAGWYKLLDGEGEPILDRDDGGTLYLVVNATTTPTAHFAAQAGGASNPINVKICTASVDSTSGARRVNQFVRSALVLAGGEDKDTITTADEKSISREYFSDGGSTAQYSNIVQIKGFGRFHPDSVQHPTDVRGTFDAATNLEMEPDELSSVAFLVRTGNVDTTDANALGYRKLKIKSEVKPSPFQFVIDANNARKIINNVFYFAGIERTVADFTGAPTSGTVYLVCTRSAYDMERREPGVWSFAISTTAGQAQTGQLVMNLKLYDFADGKVSVDYRHSFLTVPAPDFDLYYSILQYSDLKLGSGENAVTLGKIVANQDATITQKTISAGTGITVTESGGVIVIAATGASGSTSGYSTASGQYRYTVRDMRYDTDSCQLQIRYNRETWENGVMKTSEELAWQMMTGGQAVEETV